MTNRSLCAQVTLSFLTRLQRRTGAKNVCLVGGVAQNSVRHGRLEPSPQASSKP
jgi:predicted NodU family carbamoyl transferase